MTDQFDESGGTQEVKGVFRGEDGPHCAHTTVGTVALESTKNPGYGSTPAVKASRRGMTVGQVFS